MAATAAELNVTQSLFNGIMVRLRARTSPGAQAEVGWVEGLGVRALCPNTHRRLYQSIPVLVETYL